MFEFNIKHIGNQETFYKTMPPPPPHLAQSKHFEHNCFFVNDILYQNVLFVVFCARGGGGVDVQGGCVDEAVKKLKNQ